MNNYIYVATGEVKVGDGSNILISNAIGSCIVVAAIDHKNGNGAMAHIMLPGKAPYKEKQKTKYAADAIDEMLHKLQLDHTNISNLRVSLVGAGNVLNRDDDTICDSNIQSVLSILKEKQLKISARSLGGILRRSVRFDIGDAQVYFTEGESTEMKLWRW